MGAYPGQWLLLAALGLTVLGGCQGSDSDTLTLTGSSTVAPLAAELARHYEQSHEGVRVNVQSGGSARGMADARSGMADIGMVSRALRPGEARDLNAYTVARDGITMIVHADNPVGELSDEQVVAIYTGQIDNWRAAGGPDAPITVVHKAEGRSTLELFLKYYGLDNNRVQADAIIGENQQGIKTVAGNPHAIGYVSIGTAEYEAEHGTPIRLLPVGGVEASTQAVAEGRFPLSRPLNLVTPGEPSAREQAFIDYARSAEARPWVRDQFFVPVDTDD